METLHNVCKLLDSKMSSIFFFSLALNLFLGCSNKNEIPDEHDNKSKKEIATNSLDSVTLNESVDSITGNHIYTECVPGGIKL